MQAHWWHSAAGRTHARVRSQAYMTIKYKHLTHINCGKAVTHTACSVTLGSTDDCADSMNHIACTVALGWVDLEFRVSLCNTQRCALHKFCQHVTLLVFHKLTTAQKCKLGLPLLRLLPCSPHIRRCRCPLPCLRHSGRPTRCPCLCRRLLEAV